MSLFVHRQSHTQSQLTGTCSDRCAAGRILDVALLPPMPAHPQRIVFPTVSDIRQQQQQHQDKESSIREL